MKNRFCIINNELVYVLSGLFASDYFIEHGNFDKVTARSFGFLNPNNGKSDCCDRSKVQLDSSSVDVKISPIIKKCQELVEEGYEIFGEYFMYDNQCKLAKKFGKEGKYACFSTLKVWKNGQTFKTIYLHDSWRGEKEIFRKKIEREEIPKDAIEDPETESYFIFL